MIGESAEGLHLHDFLFNADKVDDLLWDGNFFPHRTRYMVVPTSGAPILERRKF